VYVSAQSISFGTGSTSFVFDEVISVENDWETLSDDVDDYWDIREDRKKK
jgi:hypothetical protein